MDLNHFMKVGDIAPAKELVAQTLALKKDISSIKNIGLGKAIALLFYNPSLRTRMSSQRAAQLLGLDNMVMDLANSWALEMQRGTVMNLDKSEHVIEAAAVVSQYCQVMGIRSFPGLRDRETDYAEPVLSAFMDNTQVPIINLESATRHPLQGLTDMATIAEHLPKRTPRVLLTWAPHPKALPQSVANSFASWSLAMGYDLTITHPIGYDLDAKITEGARIEHDPAKAYKDVDFVYAKNWSSFREYGKILSKNTDWMVDEKKMSLTNHAYFMHCLPVRRNVVVTDDVIESKRSLVIHQANNRTFAMATVLKNILDGN